MAEDIFAEKFISMSNLNSIFKQNLNVQYESMFYPNYDGNIYNRSEYYYNSNSGSVNINNIIKVSEIIKNSTDSTLISLSNSTQDYYQIYDDFNVTENPNLTRIFENSFTWSGMCLIIIFSAFIVTTIIGNTLVILAVITTRRLRTVTNCFVMSLAIADLLVGIFVMPPAVAVHLIGYWQLGWVLCDIWISLDVLLCTASILSLCAISVDRYLAVTRPLTYSRKRRSKRLALIMILVVWALALAITCPPILGWYEPGRRNDLLECRYNQNEGYVVFSAMGSFFIPMAVMIYVYARISCVVASRHENMTNIEIHNKKCKRYQRAVDIEFEFDHEQDISEQDNSSPKNRRPPTQSLSTQAFAKEVKETSFGNSTNDTTSNIATRQCRNGNYEAISINRSSSFRGPSPQMLSAKSSIASQNNTDTTYTFGHRYSVRHHGTNISSEFNVNKSTTRVHQKSISNRITSLKRENKTTQTLSIVVGGFIACWLPFFIYYLITPFISEESVNPIVAKFLTWLGWFNSAINPFIYAFYSVDFRAAFWRLTLKRFFKNPPKGQFPSNTMSIRR